MWYMHFAGYGHIATESTSLKKKCMHVCSHQTSLIYPKDNNWYPV